MVLQGAKAPQNRYLLALCHMRLGKLVDAQNALLGSAAPDSDATASVPNGAAGLYLMGVICLKSQQRQRATRYFSRCLALNPFMWCAYESLSQLGAPLPDPFKAGEPVPLPPHAGTLAAQPGPPMSAGGADFTQPAPTAVAPPGTVPGVGCA
eukprot:7386325-Prymnesium_polylepis.1